MLNMVYLQENLNRSMDSLKFLFHKRITKLKDEIAEYENIKSHKSKREIEDFEKMKIIQAKRPGDVKFNPFNNEEGNNGGSLDFIARDSIFEINISNSIYQKITNEINNGDEEFILKEIFDEADNEVLNILYTNIYGKFIKAQKNKKLFDDFELMINKSPEE
ncbi:hypothetical protein BCR32DRAFT_243454 [Anaeromyces robustus]|uniref:RGS domain-containing protein n=1 Tax=Anaeromyces robustus TaxID=1754192 RepID=A0A1Y1XCE6_9FUNG|nr:hypothetical protein BCR32DRAFT_243454 [Anaeromyces robustus]|eukprot:ORX83392.1 hypothetical protein BCR32DRAFT_243454 [Anaeromyces robustus]